MLLVAASALPKFVPNERSQRKEEVTAMPLPIMVLAGVALLAGTTLSVLAVLIVGIRRGDRAHLATAPGSPPDAFARRILVGIRYPANAEKDEISDLDN